MTILQRILAKIQELRGKESPISIPSPESRIVQMEQKPFSTSLASLNAWNAKRSEAQGICFKEPKRTEICGRGTLGCRVFHPEVAEEIYSQRDWDRAATSIQIAATKDAESHDPADLAKLSNRNGRARISRLR